MSEEKTVEGRLFKGDWKAVVVGQNMIFYDDNTQVCVEIKKITRHADFKTMYNIYGTTLLPVGIPSEVYGELYSENDVKNYGTIAVTLKYQYCMST